MMKMGSLKKRVISVVVAIAMVICSITVFPKSVDAVEASLLNTYGSYLGWSGVCINSWQLNDTNTLNHVKAEYNSITLENEMKPDYLLNSWGANLISVQEAKNRGYYIPESYTESTVPSINFSTVDSVMKKCYENGLGMRAHTLVWHSQMPEWFYKNDYSKNNGYVTPDKMDARLEFYVKTVMKHVYQSQYGSCVYAWDVLNEYVHASDDSPLVNVYGKLDSHNGKPEFVKKIFKHAHDTLNEFGIRSKVSLFYNDYNTYMDKDKIITMINYVNSDAKICDGVGMQSHVGTNFPSVQYYLEAVNAFVNQNYEVQITELDIANKSDDDLSNYTYDLLAGILKIKKNGGNITGLTWWGISDQNSWVGENNPLLFSSFNVKKDAYYKAIQAYRDNVGEPQDIPIVEGEWGIITNGGFESGNSDWSSYGETSLGLGYSTVKSGAHSLKVQNRTASWNGAVQDVTGKVKAESDYHIKASVRFNNLDNPGADGNTTFNMSIVYGNGSRTDNMASVMVGADTWGEIDAVYSVPDDVDLSNVKILFETAYTTSPGTQDLVTFYVDDVSMRKIDDTPTEAPTQSPTEKPTVAPTQQPTVAPTEAPTPAPVDQNNINVKLSASNEAYASLVSSDYSGGKAKLELSYEFSGLGVAYYINDNHSAVNLDDYQVIYNITSDKAYNMVFETKNGIQSNDYWNNGAQTSNTVYTTLQTGTNDYAFDWTGNAQAIFLKYNTYESDTTENANITVNSIKLIKDDDGRNDAPGGNNGNNGNNDGNSGNNNNNNNGSAGENGGNEGGDSGSNAENNAGDDSNNAIATPSQTPTPDGNNNAAQNGGNVTATEVPTVAPTEEPTEAPEEVSLTETYTVGSYIYKITNIEKKTAKLYKPVSNKIKKADIKATVTIAGAKYKVTAIDKNAFKNCKSLKSLTVGKNIESIEAKAFYNCKKLNNITIKGTKLKKVGKNAFKGTAKKNKLKAPKKKLKAYKKLLKKAGLR